MSTTLLQWREKSQTQTTTAIFGIFYILLFSVPLISFVHSHAITNTQICQV